MKKKKYTGLSILGAVSLLAVSCSFSEKSETTEIPSEVEASKDDASKSEVLGDKKSDKEVTQDDKETVESAETTAAEPKARNIKELVLEESIVVDDTGKDILDSASGYEVDYPVNSADKEIPSAYVSDTSGEKDFVTPVKNQGYTNLCWSLYSVPIR